MKKKPSSKPHPTTQSELGRYLTGCASAEKAVQTTKQRLRKAKAALKKARQAHREAKESSKEAAKTAKAARKYFERHGTKTLKAAPSKKKQRLRVRPKKVIAATAPLRPAPSPCSLRNPKSLFQDWEGRCSEGSWPRPTR